MQDKASIPCQLADVLKSDIYFSFKNYMELKPENIKIYFDADEKGYHVIVSARTNRFKQVGMLPKEYGQFFGAELTIDNVGNADYITLRFSNPLIFFTNSVMADRLIININSSAVFIIV